MRMTHCCRLCWRAHGDFDPGGLLNKSPINAVGTATTAHIMATTIKLAPTWSLGATTPLCTDICQKITTQNSDHSTITIFDTTCFYPIKRFVAWLFASRACVESQRPFRPLPFSAPRTVLSLVSETAGKGSRSCVGDS